MDKALEKKVRDEIADDVNKMIRNQMRKDKTGGKAYPMFMQIALAELLAEGKRACKFSSIPLKRWVKASIRGIGYEECKRLAQAGESNDPENFINRRREYNCRVNVRYRIRKGNKDKDSCDVRIRFNDLSKAHKLKFLQDISADFPPFDGYTDEAGELIESMKEALTDED